MAIKITDNFQVNIKNPIDNRFVVGSQSIPGGTSSIYPTPFYAYRDDISSNIGFVYPGLRIWDFNDNLPYVWTGTTWSNENLTGASVLGSGTPAFSAGGGYQNYITKFYDTSTVLTKSLLFDNYLHISLGSVTSVNPNSSGGLASPPLNGTAPGLTQGFHVNGRIRTNTGFVGNGAYISGLNAENIDGGPLGSGKLKLPFISTNGVSPGATYVLTSNIANSPMTQWQDILNVAPHWDPTNLGTGVGLYSGNNTSNNHYEFLSLTSQGFDIIPGTTMITLESKPATNVGSGSASVYKGLNSNKIHEFKTINSDFMNITETGDVINLNSNITSSSLQVTANGAHGIKIEIPATFEGTDYYVNGGYPGDEELGTRSKPFRTLKRCLNKILNRPSGSDAGGLLGTNNKSPNTYDPTINRPNIPNPDPNFPNGWIQDPNGIGTTFQKWEIRTGPGQPKATYKNNYYTNLPGGGSVRIIIQSYTVIDENLAINGVTYFLENGGYGSMIVVPSTATTYNSPGSPEHGLPFEYLIDMTHLVIGNTSVDRGHPRNDGYWYAPWDIGQVAGYTPITRQGVIDYTVGCRLEGSGTIQIDGNHPCRKGFFRSRGTNNYDWTIDQNLNGAGLPIITESEFGMDQNDCYLWIGSEGGYITLQMYPLPLASVGTGQFTHINTPIPLVKADETTLINREGINQNGYKTTAVPDYGVIQAEGRNLMFGESMFLAGTLVVNCDEQHMIYAKDYGNIYSESGRIYMRRNYQQVLYSEVCYTPMEITKATDYMGTGTYYKITHPGNHTATHWNNFAGTVAGASQNSTVGSVIAGYWRKSDGTILSNAPNYTAGNINWIGLIFRSNASIPNPYSGYTGQVQAVRKSYMPSNHVYDIYLKNGGNFNQGGDFYTQQNTGATEGGPCAFVCVENNIPYAGDARHPQRNGSPSTFSGFSANGGGFVTNLIYNNFIKYIADDSYLANPDYPKHNVQMKNLKISSTAHKHLISVVKNSGATYPNYMTSYNAINTYQWNTIPAQLWPVQTIPTNTSPGGTVYLSGTWINPPGWNWTQSISLGAFTNCFFYDLPINSWGYRTPFSNISLNNNLGGLLQIYGSTIELAQGFMNSKIPVFTNDAQAKDNNYPIGAIYRLNSTTGPLYQRQT